MVTIWHVATLPTDHLVLLHSSIEYHQEHATEPCWLYEDVAATCGTVIYVSTEFPLYAKCQSVPRSFQTGGVVSSTDKLVYFCPLGVCAGMS